MTRAEALASLPPDLQVLVGTLPLEARDACLDYIASDEYQAEMARSAEIAGSFGRAAARAASQAFWDVLTGRGATITICSTREHHPSIISAVYRDRIAGKPPEDQG